MENEEKLKNKKKTNEEMEIKWKLKQKRHKK